MAKRLELKTLPGQSFVLENRKFTICGLRERAANPTAPAFTTLEIRADPALRIDLHLPLEWNDRLYAVGNGGYAGEPVDMPLRDFARDAAVAKGFAVVGTNSGHDDVDDPLGKFASDKDKLIDYAERAIHQAALVAKTLLKQIYGTGPKYSYFEACSTGGRQALIAAQRYPDDFDGIIAGAPLVDFTGSNLWCVRTAQILEDANIGKREMKIVASAVRRFAGGDELAANTLDSAFDVRRDAPVAPNDPDSLTPVQAEALAAVYAPTSIGMGRTFPGIVVGAEIEGILMPGTPPMSGWEGWFFESEHGYFKAEQGSVEGVSEGIRKIFGGAFVSDMLGASKGWRDFDFSDDSMKRLPELSKLLDATNPDLSSFAARGGKLIMHHGLADAGINAARTVQYYEEVKRHMGVERVKEFARLYLAPGMFHCIGGFGASVFDLLTPLMDWVEKEVAPTEIVAQQPSPDFSHYIRSYPLTPY